MTRVFICVALLGLIGCNEGQDPQARYDTLATSLDPWPSSSSALPPPDGVVSTDALVEKAAVEQPPGVTPSLVERGRERFGVFCSPCHGFDGYGDGIIVARGFPHPPSFHSAQLRSAPPELFFDAITRGYGAMYGYADRVPAQDRWAIVAYIRALQLSQLNSGTRVQ